MPVPVPWCRLFKHSHKWARQAPGGDVDGGLWELFLWLRHYVQTFWIPPLSIGCRCARMHLLVRGHLHNTGEWFTRAGCSMMGCDTAQAGMPSAHPSQNMVSATTSVLSSSSSSCSRSVQTMLINAKLPLKWSNREGGQVPAFNSPSQNPPEIVKFAITRTRTIKRWLFFRTQQFLLSNPEGQHRSTRRGKKKKHYSETRQVGDIPCPAPASLQNQPTPLPHALWLCTVWQLHVLFLPTEVCATIKVTIIFFVFMM